MNIRFLMNPVTAALIALAVLQGCTTNPATGDRVFTGGMSPAQESKMGREYHPQILQEFGGEFGTPALKAYVDRVGQRLARTVERRNFNYKFTIVNSDIVNAFALPGGYIYISRGLLALAESEAELAGVLAHELGHVTALHHARRHGQTLVSSVLVGTLGIAGGQNVAKLGNALAGGLLSGWSREHELESDALALRYLARAGYDPQAMVDFLAKMRASSRLQAKEMGLSPDKADEASYMATHPAPIERVQTAEQQVAQYNVKNPDIGKKQYLRRINGLLYGDDPDQGFVRGRVFAHPDLRFRFEVPRQFRLSNGKSAVTAMGPNGSGIIFTMSSRPFNGPMRQYLTRVWGKDIQLNGVERLKINGLEAATGVTSARTNVGTRDIRMVAIQRNPRTIFRFQFVTEPGQTNRFTSAFRQTTYSFRTLTSSEARALKPQRIRVVQVRRGQTVQALARRMAGDPEFREERFRVINGLGPKDQLKAGEQVKLITD